MPFYNCCLCNRPFQFGDNHVYDGRHIGSWGVDICTRCIRGNWDGVEPKRRPRLLEQLRAKGVPIVLNEQGNLDIPTS
jgi:hypothetical protein